MSKPHFSVCIPTYNRARMLGAAVRSVLAQDFGDFELIISDDASTDETLQVVASFHDSRIRYCRNSRNLGIYPNHNLVWRQAQADWVIFLHNDDALQKGTLSACHRALGDGGSLASADLVMHYEGVARRLTEGGAEARPWFYDGLDAALLHVRIFGQTASGCGFRRSALEALNGFDTNEDIGYSADWDIFIRAALAGFRLGLLPFATILLGRHDDQESARWFFTARYFRNCGSVLYRSTRHKALLGRILSGMADWSAGELYKLLILACSFPEMGLAGKAYPIARDKLRGRPEQSALRHYYARRVLGRRAYWSLLETFYHLRRRRRSVFELK